MHVGARLALCRHAVSAAGDLAINEDDALVAFPNGWEVFLDDDRLAEILGKHLQERVEVFVFRCDVEHPGAAVAVERLDDDILVFVTKGEDLFAIAGDQGWRHEIRKSGDEKFLGRVSDFARIVNHQRFRTYMLEKMRCCNIGHIKRRVLAHQDNVCVGKIYLRRLSQGKVITLLVPNFHRLRHGHDAPVAHG